MTNPKKLTTGTVYLIGSGGVAKAALYKMLNLFPEQLIEVIASNRKGGLEQLSNDSKPNSHLVTYNIINLIEDPQLLRTIINRNFSDSTDDVILNLGSPYLDLVLMDIALATKCHYIDTACYEAENTKGFSYEAQLAYHDKFKAKGLTALLGAGGSPGITNVLTRFHHEHTPTNDVVIFDYNGGQQSKYLFATNFSAEDNLKELHNPTKCLKGGEWVEAPAFSDKNGINNTLMLDGYNTDANFYAIYHEEQETLNRAFPEIENIKSYMSFGDDYIKYFSLFDQIGLLNHEPVDDGCGGTVIPVKFLASLLPDPKELAPITTGVAGMVVATLHTEEGQDEPNLAFQSVWDMDHEKCYADTSTGAVAWSTGVPAVLFTEKLFEDREPGVYTPESLPNFTPATFRSLCLKYGISIRTFINGSITEL